MLFIELEKIMPASGIVTDGWYHGSTCSTPWVISTRLNKPPTAIATRLCKNRLLRAAGRALREIQLAASSMKLSTATMIHWLSAVKMNCSA